MARNLSQDALNKISERLGNEPVTIIEVDWTGDDAPPSYADRTVGPIPGRILEVGPLDNVINVSGNANSQQLSVTLDDSDGSIKAILDSHDVHQRDVRAFQYFDGLDLSDKFLLFRGKISSPVVWSEGDGRSTYNATAQFTTFRVFGGEEFPRGTITLDINGAKFIGSFLGNTDTFSVQWAVHPRQGEPLVTPRADGTTFPSGPFGFSRFVPNGNITGDTAGYFFADAGAQVRLATAEPQRFVASITPGTVKRVKAFIQSSGRRFLIDVPEDCYTVSTEQYGPVTATMVTLNDALSKRTDLSWDDQIYITFKGTVGPNTVDVMEYLIQQNTDFGTDATSFNAVRSRLANYPSHFALTDRKQILQALEETAFQARCAIVLKDDTFYLRYRQKPRGAAEY